MTRAIPESRDVSRHEMEVVVEAMDGYTQAAAEAVADHGNTITDTHPHTLAAAYIQGCATVHGAWVLSDAMDRQAAQLREALDEIAQVMKGQRNALTELAQAAGDVAAAVERGGASVASALANDVAGAIAVHSDEVAAPLEAIAASFAPRNAPHPEDEA